MTTNAADALLALTESTTANRATQAPADWSPPPGSLGDARLYIDDDRTLHERRRALQHLRHRGLEREGLWWASVLDSPVKIVSAEDLRWVRWVWDDLAAGWCRWDGSGDRCVV